MDNTTRQNYKFADDGTIVAQETRVQDIKELKNKTSRDVNTVLKWTEAPC